MHSCISIVTCQYCCATIHVLRFHSNATLNERHYYGYGRGVYEGRVLEPVSCVLGSEEKGRSGVIAVIKSCIRGLVEFRRVLELLTVINSCVRELVGVIRVLEF
jgi:hypothetical protein